VSLSHSAVSKWTKDAGKLQRIIQDAQANGYTYDDLTVLDAKKDPYRLHTPAGYRNAEWFAEQFGRFNSAAGRVHLRGFHYQLVAATGICLPAPIAGHEGLIYESTDECWNWMYKTASIAARWLGLVPFSRIIDEKNDAPEVFEAENWEIEVERTEGARIYLPRKTEIVPRFTCRLPVRQPYRIAIIGEKSSLRAVLRPIAERIHADLLLPAGECTTTMIAEMAERAVADGRLLIVLYFSDFDPSGYVMPVSVARKLQAMRDLYLPSLNVEVHPVALTLEHVRDLDLPSSPLKAKEKRADKWRDAMGREQTEIDALAALRPDALREIAEEAILPFYDPTLARRTWEAQEAWQEQADASLEENQRYQDAKNSLIEAHQELIDLVDGFEEAREHALGILHDAEPLDPPVLPEPEIDAVAPGPLFTTEDDYVSATLKLKARKAFAQEEAE
jgi:hypothetical protein